MAFPIRKFQLRPGFSAIYSGHFEDASLALKDLYDEIVILDSVFNQSKFSLGIGHDSCKFREVATQMECIATKTEIHFSK